MLFRPRSRIAANCMGAVLLASSLAACSGSASQDSEEAPLAVEIVTARRHSAMASIDGVGRVAHEREMLLSFRIPGNLVRLPVNIGDPVRRGQLLAELDSRDVAARLAQASGDVERLSRATRRYAMLHDSGAIARAQYEDSRTALAQAQAARSSAAFDRESARLTASRDGVVLERLAEAGETVAAGQGVLRLADTTSPLIVRVSIASRHVARVRPGAAASISIDGLGEPIQGVVSRIGRNADERTGSVDVEIRLARSRQLISGMVARVRISSGKAELSHLLAVPAEAILEAQGSRAAVFLFDRRGSRALRRNVQFHGFRGEQALISGIPANSSVITAGAGFARDGSRVRAISGSAL